MEQKPYYKSVQRKLNLLLQRTLFLMFPLFQKYLNSQVRNSKLLNSVVYHSCPSRLASGKDPYFFKLLRVLSLSRMFVECSDLYIPPCVAKRFQFLVVTLENALNLSIFTHAPVTHSKLLVHVLKICFPHGQEQGVEETTICFIKIQSEYVKMTWNFTSFIICMTYSYSKCDGLTVL